ncbi:MAG: glycosyltransferase family 4 protein [Flavobacteriales bacterium]|nr:glycosyltransferase family 4 protein [Flavobacteriales bacterium]
MTAPDTETTASDGPVLCVVGWWPTDPDVTGIFIREHIEVITRYRPVIVIYMEVLKGPWRWPTMEVSESVEYGIPVHRVRILTPLRRFGFGDRLVRRAFRKLVAQIQRSTPLQLIHIHVRTEVTEHVLPVAARHGLPVVVTEHNSFYHLGIRALPPAEEAAQRSAIRHWFKHPSIAAVMPVSKDLARVLNVDFGVPQGMITVVPNIAADVFRPAQGPTGDVFRMVLAAVWRPPKDHDVFIRALGSIPMELLQRCRIDWVGYGPDYQRIVERCKNELPDVDIHLPGVLDKPALAHLMQQAHLFVLPTTADNLPCVVLESLCCGTPVLSMAVNGVPELVDATNGILVPPRDPEALATALISCIRHPDRFDRGSISRDALAKYSAAAVGSSILTVQRMAVGIERA